MATKILSFAPLPQREFNIEERITTLEQYIDPKSPLYQPEGQHDNIKAVIEMYKTGELDGKGDEV